MIFIFKKCLFSSSIILGVLSSNNSLFDTLRFNSLLLCLGKIKFSLSLVDEEEFLDSTK